MQDRYTGDIGDYVKLAILRALTPRRRLGVAWWLYPNESHNSDGRHVDYLQNPDQWRSLDPQLFDGLSEIVASGRREVASLQEMTLLPGAVFASEPVSTEGSVTRRMDARAAWFARAMATIDGCDFVFVDPDNGLETKNFHPGASKAGKTISLAELDALRRPGRVLLVYHHQTRMKGGHAHEIAHWSLRLRARGFSSVDALRASPYSARAFFLLDAPDSIRERARRIAESWGPKRITWHPGGDCL